MDVVILVFVFLKLCLEIAKRSRDGWGPWVGLNDQAVEGIFQWSDGSAGEVYT